MVDAPEVLDLFCGAGGLSIGLERAGFSIVGGVDADPDSCKTFAAAHPHADVRDDDVAEIDLRTFAGVAALAGGVPCQPFSTGGKRLAAADPRNGFPHLLRAVEALRPEVVLIENVAGLARGARMEYLRQIVKSLEDLGYQVVWKIVNAADFGVPQKRKRLITVASKRFSFEFPAATHGPVAGRPWVTSGSVLRRDEVLGEFNPSAVTYAKRPDLRPSPYDGLLFNGGGRPIDLGAPSPTVLASAGGNKTPFIDTLNLVPEYHAHLVRGGEPRTGKVRGARRITVVEAALLQTFPRDMHLEGARSSQYRQVGNAVPPVLAETVGRALMKEFL